MCSVNDGSDRTIDHGSRDLIEQYELSITYRGRQRIATTATVLFRFNYAIRPSVHSDVTQLAEQMKACSPTDFDFLLQFMAPSSLLFSTLLCGKSANNQHHKLALLTTRSE